MWKFKNYTLMFALILVGIFWVLFTLRTIQIGADIKAAGMLLLGSYPISGLGVLVLHLQYIEEAIEPLTKRFGKI